jgi:ankyrin repeat protein
MLQQGFDVDSADYDARTALMIAAGKGHLTAIKQLLVAGANPNLQASAPGRT